MKIHNKYKKKWDNYFMGFCQLRFESNDEKIKELFQKYFDSNKNSYEENLLGLIFWYKIKVVKYLISYIFLQNNREYIAMNKFGNEFLEDLIKEVKRLVECKELKRMHFFSDAIHNLPHAILKNRLSSELNGMVNLDNYFKKYPDEDLENKWNKLLELSKNSPKLCDDFY